MTSSSNYLPTLKLFTETPTLSNYPTVATVVSASLPLAAVFNGQIQLTQEVTKIMSAKQRISFQPFQQFWDFKMYKVIKPKIIYSVYISRVLPDTAGTNKTSFYYPNVQFRIDYDPCCIGSMILYYSMAISVRQLLTAIKVNINGYQATGNALGMSVSSDKLTIQYAYANYFPYLHINTIQLGFANTGGQATNIHQEIPGEILYLYHTIFADPGYSEMCLRGARQDMFIIKHDPHAQYLPNVTFAVKNPAVIQNNVQYKKDKNTYSMSQDSNQNSVDFELAMLVNPNQITGADVTTNSNPQFGSKTKMVCYFDDVFALDSKVEIETPNGDSKYVEKLFMSGQAKWKVDWASIDFGDNVHGTKISQFYEDKTILKIRSNSDGINSTGSYGVGLRVFDESRDPLAQVLKKGGDQSYTQSFFKQNTPICSYTLDAVTFSLWQYIVYTGKEYKFILFQTARVGSTTSQTVTTTGELTFAVATSITLKTAIAGGKIKSINGATIDVLEPGFEYVAVDDTARINEGAIVCIVGGEDLIQATGQRGYPPVTISTAAEPNVTTIFNNIYIVDPNNQANPQSILSFMEQSISMVGLKIFQLTGGIDPLLRMGKISNIQIDQKYYRSNDFNISSIAAIYDTTSGIINPTSKNNPNWQTLRYNAAVACNAPNEERNPSISNADSISIHTYRSAHGEVDFSINLNCLFICNGIENSFPHYACSAQSIIIKILFNNPLSYINTSVSCPAREIDPLDTSDNERIFVNRVKIDNIMQCDSSQMNFVLFYSRIAWVPVLIAILTNYQFYSWVQDNYEKFYKLYDRVTAGSEYTAMELTRSNFYTRIYMWVVNQETITSSMADGNVNYDYGIPLFNQKFEMPIFDMVNYETQYQVQSGFTNYTGSDLNTTDSQQKNSVMNLCPIAGIQMKTSTKINMTDNIPWRQAMLQSYLMLEHDVVNSAYKSNNMVQFDINPVYSSKAGEFPYCMYSPAFAPTVWLCIYTRSAQTMPFGTITIAQCKNVSYIDKHIMLLKYATNQ